MGIMGNSILTVFQVGVLRETKAPAYDGGEIVKMMRRTEKFPLAWWFSTDNKLASVL